MENIDEIINKMKELRQKRELEILESQIENINLDSDYQEILKNNKVLDVKYLGEIEIKDYDKTNKSIFLLIEQEQDKDGNLIIVEKYYTEDLEFLGGNNKSDGYDFIMLNKEHMDDRDLLESLNNLDKEGKLDLEQIERKELEEIAKALGIDEKEIKAMSEIDLAKQIEEKQESQGTEDKEKDNNKEEQELSQEETKKVLNGKQEMKTSIKVDDKKTLGKVLDLNTSEYTKIAIVYSDRLQEIQDKDSIVNTTRYSFVAIRKDGTATTINDRLQIDSASGNNPYNDSIKIDADKTARKDDKTRSRYKINGKEEYLSVENGQYGELKAYYGKGKTREGNENVETQLETTNVRRTDIELRKMQADWKGKYNTDKMAKEANEHFEGHNEDKVGIKSVDGDKDTVDHVHIDFSQENIEMLAKEVAKQSMQNDEVENIFTEEEVELMSKKYIEKDLEKMKDLNYDELQEKLKEIEGKIATDANNLSRERGEN
ncbi:MAG: hypothetical protein IKF97_01030 [Clostridia bacterium]|nr:hypothetical protein [Clostridia bacterium]